MSARRRAACRNRMKTVDNHDDFLRRITKSLYYGKLPTIPCLSLPVMELSADVFSEAQKGKSLKRLYLEDASELTRNACVSPCSLVLALVYLERLKACNPEYVANMAPADLFLVSLMVSNKFLQDNGEEDEVFTDEWAASAGITAAALNKIEKQFLNAIDWRVFVNKEQFDTSLEQLEHQISTRQAKLRGWFTYTDLANINNNIENIPLIKCLATVYAALSISYLASMYSIVASSFIVSQSLIAMSSPAMLNVFEYTNHYFQERRNYSQPLSMDSECISEDTQQTEILEHIENLMYNFDTNNNDSEPAPTYNETYLVNPVYVSFLREILQLSLFNRPDNNLARNDLSQKTNWIPSINRNENCNDNIHYHNPFKHWSAMAVC